MKEVNKELIEKRAIEKIEKLEKKTGYIKILLCTPHGDEGIWAVPLTKKDHRKALDDSSEEEKIQVMIGNDSIYSSYRVGEIVEAITQGDERPLVVVE